MTIDPNNEELLWRELDAELSAEDRTRLEALLAEDPEVRATRTHVGSLAALLAKVEEAPVPQELRGKLQRVAASGRQGRFGLSGRLTPARPVYFALAAVLLVAVVGIVVFRGPGAPVADSSLVGTALPGSTRATDGVVLELPEVDGSLRFRIDGATVSAELLARRGAPLEIILEQERGALELGGTEGGGSAMGVRTEAGRIVLSTSGAGKLALTLTMDAASGSPLTVWVMAEGRAVPERRLEIEAVSGP